MLLISRSCVGMYCPSFLVGEVKLWNSGRRMLGGKPADLGAVRWFRCGMMFWVTISALRLCGVCESSAGTLVIVITVVIQSVICPSVHRSIESCPTRRERWLWRGTKVLSMRKLTAPVFQVPPNEVSVHHFPNDQRMHAQ